MDRKDCLKKTAIRFLALALLLIFATALATPARAQDEKLHRVFFFVSTSQAPSTDRIVHQMAVGGAGAFDPEKREVEGGGSYVHFNNATAGTHVTIIDAGTWEPTEFVSWTPVTSGGPNGNGTVGRITASILEMHVNLISDVDQSVRPATLRIVCNIGFANISTGQAEGFKLTINGASFGTFVPLSPLRNGITQIGTLPRDIIRGNKKAR